MAVIECLEVNDNGNGTKPSVEVNGNNNNKVTRVSRLRESIPQCFAVSAKNLLLMTFGTTLGFPTILLPALLKENSEIPLTLDEQTWMSSINLLVVPLGCLVSGPVSQVLGRKKSMLLANIPFIAVWILFYYSNTSAMLFVALALTGFTGGLIEGPVLTYVAEVTQPHLRGLLSATSTMSVIFGVFSQMLAGRFADWRTVTLINLAFPILCAMTLALVPESPYWLAGKGRVKEAERALCFLRGWVSPEIIREELKTIIMTVKQPSDTRQVDDTKKEKFWAPYFRKSVVIPFFLVSFAFFLPAFGGSATLQTYAVLIFNDLNAPMDKYTATVCLGIAQIVGTLICVLCIHFTGKRKLNFFSIGGTGLCFFGSAIYLFLIKSGVIDDKIYSWIPTTLLIGAALFAHTGTKELPWILAGEVFPAKVRGSLTGVVASIGYIFTSIVNKTFVYMKNEIDFSGTFLFYVAMNLIGAITLYFILPETEGRTLRDIEEHYAGINNLKNKPKNKELPFKEKWAATNPTLVQDEVESKL